MTALASRPAAVDFDAAIEALDRIRPFILGHGGDAEIVGISDQGVVEVTFHGACQACPNVAMTFVGPVRTALMQVKGVSEVNSANVHAGPRALARMARLLGAHPVST